MSTIELNQRKLQDLVSAPETGPIVMVNLLKFKPETGAAEYAKYGEAVAPMIRALGGKALYIGRVLQTIVGPDGQDYDAVALVEYPSRAAFVKMLSSAEYQKIHEHRERGLERTLLYATQPISSVGSL